MKRRNFSKTLIFLMLFNLVFLQAYPLTFALAAEPGAEVVTEEPADESSSKDEADSSEKDTEEESDKKTSDDLKKEEAAKEETTSDAKDKKEEETDTSTDGTVSPSLEANAEGQYAEVKIDQAGGSADILPDGSSVPVVSEDAPGVEAENATDLARAAEEISVNAPAEEDILNGENGEALSIVNTNDTTAENTVSTVSDTGGNGAIVTASDQSPATVPEDESAPDATSADASTEKDGSVLEVANETNSSTAIATGDAESVTVIENNINTNVTTENGTVSNMDIYDYTGDINLLEAFNAVLANAKEVVEQSDDAINLTIQNINSAVVKNDATTSSDTGGNSAEGDGADIETGDAFSVTDIVNYINTNIVGNNWLYVTLNIFGNWNGNLIVPGEGLLNVGAARIFSDINILNENSADVENNVTTLAVTGENSAGGSGLDGVSIETGTATAETNVANILNTNIVKNNWFLLLFNNMGTWTGRLLNWGGDDSTVLAYDFSGAYSGVSLGALSVTNQNSAQVSNEVETIANTGGNSATGNVGGANINTGNASAFSNIFNMINTNIIGDNWFFAVVNNMGNWNGNVEFAYPDLAVALSSENDQAPPGADVTYTVHYKNFGQAASEGAQLHVDLPSSLRAEKTSWDLPGLESGEEGSLDVKVKVQSDLDSGTILKLSADISSQTKEINLDNNSATSEMGVYVSLAYDETENLDSKIAIKRSSDSVGQARPGDRVKNTIIVENKSDNDLYNILVNDKMSLSAGSELGDFSWPIEKIKEGDKVMIQYEFIVNNPGQQVTVNYVARATAQDSAGHAVTSRKVASLLTVLGFVPSVSAAGPESTPIVAGAEAKNDVSAGSILQDAADRGHDWPVLIWLASVVVYSLYALWKRFPLRKKLAG